MKGGNSQEGPWEFGERPIVKQNADSVNKGQEKRKLNSQMIMEVGAEQAV